MEKRGHEHTEEQDRLRGIEHEYQLLMADCKALTDEVKLLEPTPPMQRQVDEVYTFISQLKSQRIADMDRLLLEAKAGTVKELIRGLRKRKREQDQNESSSEDLPYSPREESESDEEDISSDHG